jgi:uncharacterized protein YbjT (DUF2867 family)/ligand-binding SRPBCC domain-containing protein
MSTYRLTARQLVPAPIDEVFGFFAEPRNLNRLTPASMRFEFLTDDFEMREGLEIEYRLRPLLGVPARWKTLITSFDPPHSFTDVQTAGPYRRWEHAHRFRSVEGGTLVEDEIDYELPLGPLGRLGHRLAVRSELERIFSHRARTLTSIFEPAGPNPAPLSVAVAGGTGFVGGAIAQELHRRGHSVIVLSSRGEEARGGLPDSVEIRRADVTDPSTDLPAALHGADALVISLAFRNLPIEAPRRGRTFEQVDAAGTERLVAAAGRAGVASVLYISGAGAAPDAPRHWFRAKWRAEESLRTSLLRWTIIRPTWIYGPRDVSLNRFIGFARRLPFVPLTNFGGQQLAPVFVDDVGRLAADALVDPAAAGQVFELGGPDTMTMRSVIGRALQAAGLRRPIVPGPAPLIKLAAAPLALFPEPLLTPGAVDFINQPATVDVGPLLARMPRRLTPLDEGLATYLPPDAGPGELSLGLTNGRPLNAATTDGSMP